MKLFSSRYLTLQCTFAICILLLIIYILFINYYKKLTSDYPIKSIEDPFAENDWLAWNRLMKSVKGIISSSCF